MLFNSFQFIFIFLPITFGSYFFLLKNNFIVSSRLFLLFSSIFFYSYWNIYYLPLLIFSIAFNYKIGREVTIHSKKSYKQRKSIYVFGILVNIFLLAYFKYYNFFISNTNLIFNTNYTILNLALPLAISFFTFQQIAYITDSFKGKAVEHDLLNYSLFITFFPQLIAGPIVHHKTMMPQFDKLKNNTINYENIAKGLFIFSLGLIKKIFIADTFSEWANYGFGNPYNLNLIEAWVASIAFGFQLYFDFSGYTDMAIGLALLFNIKLPVNFSSPYKACNIQDFWQRWHITLSTFLRDYISLPLKKRNVSLHTNILLTFLVSGIWHGAGWNFIIFGLLHGTALIIHDVWKKHGFRMNKMIAWLITFNFLTIARIFFRANNVDDALHILYTMISGHIVFPYRLEESLNFLTQYNISFGHYLGHLHTNSISIFLIFCCFIIILFFKSSSELMQQMKPNKKYLFITALLLVSSFSYLDREQQFYYFIF